LSVRATEKLVRDALAREAQAPARKSPDPDVARLETEIAERLGAPVSIRHSRKGRGEVIIRYSSLDELDGILTHLR
jgi:ParB family chromosome partitioning protein